MTKPIRIYIAGPLFTQAEWLWNERLAAGLRERGFDAFLPQASAVPMLNGTIPFDPAALFRGNVEALSRSAAVVAVLDGADADSGTCWECGYAFARGIPVVGVRTDIRQSGDDGALNLMLTQSCRSVVVASMDNRTDIDALVMEIAERVQEAAGG